MYQSEYFSPVSIIKQNIITNNLILIVTRHLIAKKFRLFCIICVAYVIVKADVKAYQSARHYI